MNGNVYFLAESVENIFRLLVPNEIIEIDVPERTILANSYQIRRYQIHASIFLDPTDDWRTVTIRHTFLYNDTPYELVHRVNTHRPYATLKRKGLEIRGSAIAAARRIIEGQEPRLGYDIIHENETTEAPTRNIRTNEEKSVSWIPIRTRSW